MDWFFIVVLPLMVLLGVAKSREQARRVALLGSQLQPYRIEKLMQELTEGIMRGVGERDANRREQVWQLLEGDGHALGAQFERFATAFARLDPALTRVSKLPVALPLAERWLPPTATFDARAAFAIHARGIFDAAANTRRLSPKDKAFTLMAELFLMQHTCHWFCRSKTVASARLLARHKTAYRLALDSISPATRAAYRTLTGV